MTCVTSLKFEPFIPQEKPISLSNKKICEWKNLEMKQRYQEKIQLPFFLLEKVIKFVLGKGKPKSFSKKIY